MTFTLGSKRADMIREAFYWLIFMRCVDKLDNYTFGMLVGALFLYYFGNRTLVSTKGNDNGTSKDNAGQ